MSKIDVKDVNKALIVDAEKNYFDQIDKAVNEIIETKKPIVYLSGPSSSGKTTTGTKIMEKLMENGHDAVLISLDNFYKDRDDIRILENGVHDVENIDALDADTFRVVVNKLLAGDSCKIPTYDFKEGKRTKEVIKIVADDTRVCIFEGIHALNPLLMGDSVDYSYKIFISVATDIYQQKELWLPQHEIRLIRRMVRDYTHRGSSIEHTLSLWRGVLAGEEKFIYPYVVNADAIINSFHSYETRMLKEKYDGITDGNSDGYINELKEKLAAFESLSIDELPKDSLLNEFLR